MAGTPGGSLAYASFAYILTNLTIISVSSSRSNPEDFLLLNPNTRTCPVFRTQRDAEITLSIYRRLPILVHEEEPNGNPWSITFMRMFDMSNDSSILRDP